MTKFFILPMLLLATISSHAQYRRTQMQMPVADKTKEIPMKPIVVEVSLLVCLMELLLNLLFE